MLTYAHVCRREEAEHEGSVWVSAAPSEEAMRDGKPVATAGGVEQMAGGVGMQVSIRQHTSAYVSIRQHTSAYVRIGVEQMAGGVGMQVSIRQHTSAYVSIRQHTSAYVSIRQGCRHA
jgi:predicted hotdog family 3-hydroxylacyl-ACP dehydratase